MESHFYLKMAVLFFAEIKGHLEDLIKQSVSVTLLLVHFTSFFQAFLFSFYQLLLLFYATTHQPFEAVLLS